MVLVKEAVQNVPEQTEIRTEGTAPLFNDPKLPRTGDAIFFDRNAQAEPFTPDWRFHTQPVIGSTIVFDFSTTPPRNEEPRKRGLSKEALKKAAREWDNGVGKPRTVEVKKVGPHTDEVTVTHEEGTSRSTRYDADNGDEVD